MATALVRESARAARVRLDEFAERWRMSGRSLQRRVSAAVGMRPGLLLPIPRFRRFFAALGDGNSGAHATIAREHGYFDHALLVRDFGEFAGGPPAAFLRRVGDADCGRLSDGAACAQCGGMLRPREVPAALAS